MPLTRCCRTSTRWDAEAGAVQGDSFMKVMVVLVGLSWCCLISNSWAQVPCRAVVRANIQVTAPSVVLSDVLTPESCPELLAATARVRLGATPLAGSPRIMDDEHVRVLLQTAAAHSGALQQRLLLLDVPERVTLQSASAVPLAASAGASKSKPRVRTLVKPGQRVELLWDQGGIRLRTSAVCLQAGDAGETVRARFAHSGRVVRALVLPDGRLRANS